MRIDEHKPLKGKELKELMNKRLKECNRILRLMCRVEKFMNSKDYKSTLVFK